MKNLFAFALIAATGALAIPFSHDGIHIGTIIHKRGEPTVPSTEDAKKMLEGLTVGDKKNKDSYKRDKFGHGWITINGTCNTREVVLKVQGTDVTQDKQCKATAGNWVSPYDDAKYTDAHDLQIDHIVPLQEAWMSGASEWDDDKRKAYANDLERPLLWAVTSSLNEQKGADDPSKWAPPLKSFHCTYAKAYTAVKSYNKLTVTDEEKKAISGMLDTCSDKKTKKPRKPRTPIRW